MTDVPVGRGTRFVFVTEGPTAGAGRFAWRLDAANNRPLGRGVGTHASLAACQQWLAELRGDAAADVAADAAGQGDSVSFDSARGLWTWRMRRDGRLCATSVRAYLRRFECRRAAAHFARALADTPTDSGVVRVVRAEVLDRYAAGVPGAGVLR